MQAAFRARAVAIAFALSLCGAAPAQEFTVVSSNLWMSGTQGFHYPTQAMPLGRLITLPGIVDFLRLQAADRNYAIFGLQEVDSGTRRSGYLNVPQLIDNALGPGWVNRFGALHDYDGGKFGNAIVSKIPIVKTLYWRFAHDPNNKADYGKWQRGAIATKLDMGGKRLWFVNVHLEALNAHAVTQAWQLMGKIKTLDPDFPVVVVGDFNIRNRRPEEGRAERAYHTLATIFGEASGFTDVSKGLTTSLAAPTTKMDGQLDYVFVYDPHERISLIECKARLVYSYPNVFSDHLAVVARFRWN